MSTQRERALPRKRQWPSRSGRVRIWGYRGSTATSTATTRVRRLSQRGSGLSLTEPGRLMNRRRRSGFTQWIIIDQTGKIRGLRSYKAARLNVFDNRLDQDVAAMEGRFQGRGRPPTQAAECQTLVLVSVFRMQLSKGRISRLTATDITVVNAPTFRPPARRLPAPRNAEAASIHRRRTR